MSNLSGTPVPSDQLPSSVAPSSSSTAASGEPVAPEDLPEGLAGGQAPQESFGGFLQSIESALPADALAVGNAIHNTVGGALSDLVGRGADANLVTAFDQATGKPVAAQVQQAADHPLADIASGLEQAAQHPETALEGPQGGLATVQQPTTLNDYAHAIAGGALMGPAGAEADGGTVLRGILGGAAGGLGQEYAAQHGLTGPGEQAVAGLLGGALASPATTMEPVPAEGGAGAALAALPGAEPEGPVTPQETAALGQKMLASGAMKGANAGSDESAAQPAATSASNESGRTTEPSEHTQKFLSLVPKEDADARVVDPETVSLTRAGNNPELPIPADKLTPILASASAHGVTLQVDAPTHEDQHYYESHGFHAVTDQPMALMERGPDNMPPEPSHAIDETGEHQISLPGGKLYAQENSIRLGPPGSERTQPTVQVKRSDVEKSARGQGIGYDLYREAANHALAEGKFLTSDVSVSPAAAHVYKKLQDAGYMVRQSPSHINPETGNYVSDDPLYPVFVVTDAPKPLTDETKGPMTFVSGERAGQSPEQNSTRTHFMREQLLGKKLPFRPTSGAFEGTPERSFAVSNRTPQDNAAIEELGKRFDQDALMHVDGEGNAILHDLRTGEKTPIGKFVKATRQEAALSPGWTRDASGQYYVVKPHEEKPAEAPAQGAPEQQRAESANKPLPKPFFRDPGDDNARVITRNPAERAALVRQLKRVGVQEIPRSVLDGDRREMASDYQTSLIPEGGKRMYDVIEALRDRLRTGAEGMQRRAGGTIDNKSASALYSRGATITRPIERFEKFLDDRILQSYKKSDAAAAKTPVDLLKLEDMLTNHRSQFLLTSEGTHFLNGLEARLRELGLNGPNGRILRTDGRTVEELRKFVNSVYDRRIARLQYAVKDALDEDATKAAGENQYKEARSWRTIRSIMLEEQPGISRLRGPEDRLAQDRDVPLEQVPQYLLSSRVPLDQFRHIVHTLHVMSHYDPSLAEDAAAAINEIRSIFANGMKEAGDHTKGLWDAKAVSNFLRANDAKMREVFRPTEMRDFQDIHDVGNATNALDRSYKGSAAQTLDFASKGVVAAARHVPGHLGAWVTHGAAGSIVGDVVGEPLARHLSGGALKRLVEKRITQLAAEPDEPGPEKPARRFKSPPRAQRGGPKFTPQRQAEAERGGAGADQMVKVYHHTSRAGAAAIRSTGMLQSAAEPHVYVTTHPTPDIGYGDHVVPLRVPASKLELDDEFPGGRKDYRLNVGKPGGAIPVEVGHGAPLTFRHFTTSPETPERLMLSPDYYGRGIAGAERSRIAAGAPKVMSAYAADHPDDQVEPGLKGKPEYRITVPEGRMYDLSADPEGIRKKATTPSGHYDHTEAELMMKSRGYLGYHVPNGVGIMKGQARFFQPVEAVRRDVAERENAPQKAPAALPRTQRGGGAKVGGPRLPTRARFLTPEEREDLKGKAITKLVNAFRGLPSSDELGAAALAGEAKRGWYRHASNAISTVFGGDAPRFAALLAAMSPQTSVEMNFHNALRTFVAWDDAGRPQDRASIVRLMEENSLKNPESTSRSNVLDAWKNNAVRALTAKDPESVQLSGPKVDSFMRNLRGDVNAVTLDSWMAAFANMDPQRLKALHRKAAADVVSGSLGHKGPGYLAYSALVREAAQKLSKWTHETWTPAEVQETVWSFSKTASEHADSYGGMATIPELVKNGDIHDELIRGTSDFHNLFQQPEHAAVLGDSNFRGGLEALRQQESDTAKPRAPSEARKATEEALKTHLEKAAKRLEKVRVEKLSRKGGTDEEEDL